ncbi:uncharacterized protein FA14DRAFT_159417 [Meira miltonrushii]|uniref:DH domain-containing protein n=1 Tax=Meira miltonrushii TaxID=1280837 RepID=A0A316VI77_9BASI|nr:uncharacterized protein FA14DRAFT_159417 [Meira miltonrushii]PWN37302.1 hypothetical protein FA14DRAFT_159417 [Meira miltonrushii]
MRKFFNRLATGNTAHAEGVGTRGELNYDAQFNGGKSKINEKREGYGEKVGLIDGLGGESPTRERNGSGERVKALAARYETLSTQRESVQHSPIDKNRNTSSNWLSATRSATNTSEDTRNSQKDSTSPDLSGSPQPRRERSHILGFHKPLPPIAHQPQSTPSQGVLLPESQLSSEGDGMLPAVLHAGSMGENGENMDLMQNDLKQTQSHTSTSAQNRHLSTTPVPNQPKTVAFAPSPKKPYRTSSPLPTEYSNVPALPDRALEEVSRYQHGSLSSAQSVGNFAKPTMASTARARAGAAAATSKQSQRDTGPNLTTTSPALISPVARHGTEKFPTSGGGPSRPSSGGQATGTTKMVRSNSASASQRRNGTLSSGSAGAHIPASSTVSLMQNTREGAGHLPNSIPFANQTSALGLLRSASPQSVGTGSSASAHGRPVPDFFGNHRRSSLQGQLPGGSQGFTSSIRSIGAPSWSEMTQEDLVNNLGARERTRQEVLWEIVASEERYVQELEKTKEFFLDLLLHPHRFSPPGSPGGVHAATLATLEGRGTKKGRKETPPSSARPLTSPSQTAVSNELPIASRFLSAASGLRESGDGPYGSIDAAAISHAAAQKNVGSRSPYSTGLATSPTPATRPRSSGGSNNTPNTPVAGSSNTNLTSQPAKKGHVKEKSGSKEESTAKRWSQRRSKGLSGNSFSSSQIGYDLTNGQGLGITLPPPLRAVLEVIDNGILEGHALLSEALRIRYEEQWPLVRSLADVFTRFSYVLKHYRDYVVHLERALDCLEEAALMERAMRGKRLRKDRLSVMVGLGRAVASLEASAAERGECGLAIFLAMPFQRLLKYPLLFQNLLFHTDASTYEFESTVQMVVDVEKIVRTIEDEKVNKEERDKTIDAFARIEGIKDRALLRPKSDRILIEEKPMYQENPRRAISDSNDKGAGSKTGHSSNDLSADSMVSNTAMSTPTGTGSGNLRASIRNKRSYRRLSDLLTLSNANHSTTGEDGNVTYTKAPNMGSKKDIWLIRFSDVELRCQRVGVTALPMVSSVALQPSALDASAEVSNANAENQEAIDSTLTDDEARMRDEFKRTKESKERMRALRNTTLRSKTRNLYKFIGVTSWKATRERSNIEESEGLEGLSTALEEDEEMQDEEEEEDGGDDNESNTSQETDGGLLDPDHYVRQSKLSFSYGGQDRVEPKLSYSSTRPNYRNARTSSIPSSFKRHSMGASLVNTSQSVTSMSPISSIDSDNSVSLTKAVVATSRIRSDKFGNRLRSSDENHQRRGSMPNVTSNVSVPIGALSSQVSVIHDDQNEESSRDETMSRPGLIISKASDTPEDVLQNNRAPSFMHDRSLDSNMILMGSLVQPSAKF